jgi:DNA uptake protein ComE-like DNA-binding protein
VPVSGVNSAAVDGHLRSASKPPDSWQHPTSRYRDHQEDAAPAKKQASAKTEQPVVTTKVNLNTANAQALDTLPQIGHARNESGSLKNREDFVARKVVPSNAQ